MNLGEALRHGYQKLVKHSDAPDLDAQRLLAYALHIHTNSYFFSHNEQQLSSEERAKFESFLDQRITGIPLAYILGAWDFFGREFIITPDVLIPRPETEKLIEKALSAIQHIHQEKKRKIIVADIGTGSGCIAITLALESSFIESLFATDISSEALHVAKKNAKKYSLEDKITFIKGNYLEAIENLPIDLIVSNPPYVPSSELKAETTVITAGLTYEPIIALDGGFNGKKFISQLQKTSIPCIAETLNGEIVSFNL